MENSKTKSWTVYWELETFLRTKKKKVLVRFCGRKRTWIAYSVDFDVALIFGDLLGQGLGRSCWTNALSFCVPFGSGFSANVQGKKRKLVFCFYFRTSRCWRPLASLSEFARKVVAFCYISVFHSGFSYGFDYSFCIFLIDSVCKDSMWLNTDLCLWRKFLYVCG